MYTQSSVTFWVAVEGWQYIEVAGQLSPSPVHFVGVSAHCKSGKLRGLEENARDGIILSSGSPPGWEHNTTSSMGTTASLFSDHIALWTLCQSVARVQNTVLGRQHGQPDWTRSVCCVGHLPVVKGQTIELVIEWIWTTSTLTRFSAALDFWIIMDRLFLANFSNCWFG